MYYYEEYLKNNVHSPHLNFVKLLSNEVTNEKIIELSKNKTVVILLYASNSEYPVAQLRTAIFEFINLESKTPIIICHGDWEGNDDSYYKNQLKVSSEIGALLIDGLGDGISLGFEEGENPHAFINRTAFGILQATRTRISKTEYISCPSCGRTLFDLQETTAKIRQRTDHLKGVKIAIMGCIVNGPGEMADADYGYVGVGIGKITLYRGKDIVRRGIDSSLAVDALIDLIKEDGIWIEKKI